MDVSMLDTEEAPDIDEGLLQESVANSVLQEMNTN